MSRFVSGFQTCPSFLFTTIRNTKNCVSKSDITLTWFLTIALPKIKILLSNCVCIVCMYVDSMYFVFFDIFEIVNFIDNHFLLNEILIFGAKFGKKY